MLNLFQRRILGALNLSAKYPTLAGPGRLSYSHIYAGTVPAAEVARRRKANKVARASRRMNRKAA
ncbi:hypothetical protein HOU52_gp57 [Arthrobacter phage Yang]|uniref:Uncharacterized protein n=1 Tax=Arthrobacter phage Yang TaxID=2419970 RepID=A0A3G2KJI4_9CAUD|nr:hypothetical protein HOU52_gp57 [Arthrobacter phage Yang]AYN59142.1 hypothetical protein PBI_YANG_57 [Arthrobacter phage Yang]